MSTTRAVTEVCSAAVLAAGPPPTPAVGQGWALRRASSTGVDLALVHQWMNSPHIAARWGQAWPAQRWAQELSAQTAGEHSRPWIASREGTDLAYVEIYRPARDVVAAHYDAQPGDLGIHLAIGDQTRTGQGLGTTLVRVICEGLWQSDPACTRILADPEAGHGAARAMFARAGFALLDEVSLPHKRAALMIRPRS
ncbi:MAG: GNAT family N-acetyltransferase [Sporichthyaceae bacterium]